MTEQARDFALHMKCVLPAAPTAVFEAFTKPEKLAMWWGPRGFSIPSIEIDFRVGGQYRFAMQPPDGVLFHLTGKFCEIDPPSRLSYTFVWEPPDPDDQETVVTLSFQDADKSTEVDLTQRVFATKARRTLHERGWTDSFERLREALSADLARFTK